MNMEQNNPLVVCSGLTKTYGVFTALDHLDLTLERGRFIGLLGPNGSGKTTTIKLLNGLLQPTAGTVTINGMQPGRGTHSIVSYLPDRACLDENMKVADIIDFFSDFYRDFDRVKATEMLNTLNLSSLSRLKALSKVSCQPGNIPGMFKYRLLPFPIFTDMRKILHKQPPL